MSSPIQATIPCSANTNASTNAEPNPQLAECFLVQIHPLDLDRGPIELEDDVILGRSVDCDLRVEDDSVSRQHARIHRCIDGLVVTDLGSTHGIRVNNQCTDQRALTSGDRLQLGGHVFRFLAGHDFESQYHETMYAMMTRDGMTGVYNKRYLLECLEREIARCKRYQRPVAIAMIDIDHFKLVNDTHGHLVGDEVLQEVAVRLEKTLRNDEVLARFGGEEFALVMAEADVHQAFDVAERCRRAICERPFETQVGELEVTASFGVAAPVPSELTTPDQLMFDADTRLHDAKINGRNRVAVDMPFKAASRPKQRVRRRENE